MVKRLIVKKENLLKYYGKVMPTLDYRLRYDACNWTSLDDSRLRAVDHLQLRVYNDGIDFNRHGANLQTYQALRIFDDCSQNILILPKDLIEIVEMPGTLEIFPKVLDSMFPDRYWFRSEMGQIMLYLLFPELEIQNTPGGKHTIKDLIVKIYLRDDCSLEHHGLYGVRARMTKEEINAGYQHSHLDSMGQDMSTFCLGGGSAFNIYLKNCTMRSLSEQEFALLLVQIEQYLKWESLEGKPHKMMSNISAGSANTPQVTESATTNIAKVARGVLSKLTPDLIHKKGSVYIVNPGLNQDKWLELETYMISNGCAAHDYSVERGQWVNIPVSSSESSLPMFWRTTEGKQVQKALKLSPSIITSDTVTVDKSIIKRVSPGTFKQVTDHLVTMLNKHTKVTNNEQSNVNRESESNNNTQAVQPSVMPPQPVPEG